MKKRILSLIIILVMAIGFLPTVAFAYISGLSYELSIISGGVLITGCDTSVTTVEIPTSLNGERVVGIDANAFYGCSNLKSITIPESVRFIGNHAFSGCSSLKSITIPDSVTSIGDYAFKDCSSLTSITIPGSMTSISWCAFDGCTSLTSITIPNSVTEIGNEAFKDCSSLTSITIPNSVTEIGNDAFSGCSSLETITVSENNQHYLSQDGVLFNKNKTELISYPSRKTNYEYNIPNSVTSIGSYAFFDCDNLTTITIPNSVTEIGWYTFEDCTSLTSITIPESVTEIGWSAFSGCTSLKTVNYGGTEQQRNNISIEDYNDDLLNATWVYSGCDHKYDNACDTDCNKCGETRETTHAYGDYISNNDATYEADGTKTRTCSVCGLNDTVVDEGSKLDINADGCTVTNTFTGERYSSIEDALDSANEGDTIKLTADVSAQSLLVNPGVSLDLNGYKLTATRFVGFEDSNVYDSSTASKGSLYVAKNKLVLSKDNTQLPVYDAQNGCYQFLKINLARANKFVYSNGAYTAEPVFGDSAKIANGIAKTLFSQGRNKSGVNVRIRVSWIDKDGTYDATQDYTFTDTMVSKVVNSFTGSKYGTIFGATFSDAVLTQGESIEISTIVDSATGVQLSSDTITISIAQ